MIQSGTSTTLESCGAMETLTNKRQQHGGHQQSLTNKRTRRSDSPPPAARSRWLILNSCIDDQGAGDSSVADAKTTAASCTSSGKSFRISFGIAVPPACCSLHFDWVDGGGMPCDRDGKAGKHPKSEPAGVRVIAGHDDALLIEIKMRVLNPNVHSGLPPITTTFDDYFLYEAGGGARPPSLSLLPGFYIPVQSGDRNHSDPTPRFRNLGTGNTGILRRGQDDVVVCQFEKTRDPPIYHTAELCMLRIGRDREWIVKRRVPTIEHRGRSSELRPWDRLGFIAHAAVPVGNRFLCWVDYNSSFIVCDMADEETPKLRHAPLPATQLQYKWCCRTLGAAGPDEVRFVGCLGKMGSEYSSSSFNVTIWTITLSTEEATTWVKIIVLDCQDIWKWRLPNYGCLPRDKHLEYPVVSSDDPDVIYFEVEAMAVAINTRNKQLLSVVPSGTKDRSNKPLSHFIMAKLRW